MQLLIFLYLEKKLLNNNGFKFIYLVGLHVTLFFSSVLCAVHLIRDVFSTQMYSPSLIWIVTGDCARSAQHERHPNL